MINTARTHNNNNVRMYGCMHEHAKTHHMDDEYNI